MRNVRHAACALPLLLLVAATASAADPYVGYVYPAGLQAGTTNRLVVGGQGFWGPLGAGVTGGGVHVTGVERMASSGPPSSSQQAWLKKWLDGIIERNDRTRPALPTNAAARVGEWTLNAWWKTLDQLDRRALEAVERDIFVRKNALQMTPSLRQILFVDVVVDADALPGRRDFCVWTQGGISPPRPFLVTSEPHVEEPCYSPPHRKAAPVPLVKSFPVVLNGRILPGETDRFELRLKKGMSFSCDVTARELQPYVGDAVPGFFNAVARLIGPDGREVAFADDRNRFLPDPFLSVTIPADGTYRLEIHDNLFRGREDFVYSMKVSAASAPAGKDVPPSPGNKAKPSAIKCGETVKGTIAQGAKDTYGVRLEGPGAYIFDLRARRDGSSLDGVLTLRDAAGKVVWRRDDVTNTFFVGSIAQSECDAIGRVELSAGEKRDFTITVEDLTGHGGSNYGYALSLRREKPGFNVYAGRSAVVSRLGTRQPMMMHVERFGGFTGPVTLLETAEYRFENGYIPAGTNEFKSILIGKTRSETPLRPVRIRAFAEPDGRPQVVDVVPTDEYMQAFAWRHLLPARSFLAKNLPPWPPRLQNLKSTETLLLAGTAATPGLVRNIRLFFDLRRPNRAPDVSATNSLPHLPVPSKTRLMLLTPMPYDQYGDQRTENRMLNGSLAAEAAEIRMTASMKGIPLADIYDPLTYTLRERVEMRLCGEDRHTPSDTLELLAAAHVLDALKEDPEVARVEIDAVSRKENVSGARIRDVKLSKNGGSFVYVARSLPFPATATYRKVDKMYPFTKKFNAETFAIKRLDPGKYALVFSGVEIGTYPASELAKGVNVALLDTPGQRLAQAAAASIAGEGYAPPRPKPVRVDIKPVD